MSAAAERLAYAAIGRDLIAAQGSRGDRRAALLQGRPTGSPATSFAALYEAPTWLRWPRPRQIELARLVALRSMAPTLAASIDGAWLGALAEVAGERALDWAIAKGRGDAVDAEPIVPSLTPDDLVRHGFAMLASRLPAGLKGYLALPTAPSSTITDPGIIADALAFVDELPA